MRARILLLLALPACGFRPTATSDAGSDGPLVMPIDAPDGPPGQICYGSLATVCFVAPAMDMLTLNADVNTTSDTRCLSTVASSCVLTARTITVPATVNVTGNRPLYLLATEAITIAGTLDASSTAGRTGAGANDATCGTFTAPGNGNYPNQQQSGGGGAGGTFGERGGAGGTGSPDGTSEPGGTAPAVFAVTTLRGGCAGQNGGDGNATRPGVAGGSSGGAIYLVAGAPGGPGTITIPGRVFASGAGGANVTGMNGAATGGGGGGSGGMLAFEAMTITIAGIVAANGGGGSGGGGANTGGDPGSAGTTTSYNAAASGGAGADNGAGDGGSGGALGHTAGAAIPSGGSGNFGAGGGGGGGIGIVWVKGTFSGTQVSPAPTIQ